MIPDRSKTGNCKGYLPVYRYKGESTWKTIEHELKPLSSAVGRLRGFPPAFTSEKAPAIIGLLDFDQAKGIACQAKCQAGLSDYDIEIGVKEFSVVYEVRSNFTNYIPITNELASEQE